MSKTVKELECAYNALSDASLHLYKAGFSILSMDAQNLYEKVEQTLDALYEAQKEEE